MSKSYIPSTLVDLLHWRAVNQPDQLAYLFLLDGEEATINLSYAELDRQARAIGALLQDRLNVAGERALLLYPSGLDFIAAFFGCLYAGVVAVPAYPPVPSRLNRTLPRLQAIVRDAQPAIVLTTSSILSAAEGLLAQMGNLQGVSWQATDKCDDGLAQLWDSPEIDHDTLAFLQYTSGSTSVPKGVMVSHGNVLHNAQMIKDSFEHSEESTFVGWLPLYHDMGLIGNVLQPLYIGARCIFMPPEYFLQKPVRWLQAISRYRARTSGGPNFAYDLCVRKVTVSQRAMLDLSSWQVAFNGAEPVRADTLTRFAETFAVCGFRRTAFYPCYGLAEATLLVSGGEASALPKTCTFREAALENHYAIMTSELEDGIVLVGNGRTLLGQEIVIVDPSSLTRCPLGKVGEIWLSGASIAQGYWNKAIETEHTFRAYLKNSGEGPFLRSGDLGFIEDSELFITGRLKDLIIIDGRNHYPQDIELTIEQTHIAIRAGCCAAFSIWVDGQERLVVVAELTRDRPSELELVSKVIRQAISAHHDLQLYALSLLETSSIPKTSSGKIQRFVCRDRFLAGTLNVIGAYHYVTRITK